MLTTVSEWYLLTKLMTRLYKLHDAMLQYILCTENYLATDAYQWYNGKVHSFISTSIY